MANEIQASVALKCTKGTYPAGLARNGVNISGRQFNQSGTNQSTGIASIGFAAHEAIPITDIGTSGWAYFQNLDLTNFVRIGIDVGATFHAFGKLLPGEFAVIPLAAAPYAQADTAACDVEYWVIER